MQTKNSSNNSAVLLQKSSCTRLRRIQNLSGNVQTKTVHTTSFLVSGQFFLVPALDQELPVDICCRRVFCTYFRPCSEIATKYLSKNEVDLFHTISGSLYFLGKLQNLLQKNQDCNGSQKTITTTSSTKWKREYRSLWSTFVKWNPDTHFYGHLLLFWLIVSKQKGIEVAGHTAATHVICHEDNGVGGVGGFSSAEWPRQGSLNSPVTLWL